LCSSLHLNPDPDHASSPIREAFAQYHTSADIIQLVNPQQLEQSLVRLMDVITVIEGNPHHDNQSPYGEPRRCKRGRYSAQLLERHGLLKALGDD
jgi:aminopeptidase-like protein